MKKSLLAAAAILAILGSASVRAETVDIATVKCSDLASMSDSDGTFLFTWLLGYEAGQAGTTTMDLSKMESVGKEIGDYCAKNPAVGVLSAATEVMQ